MRLACLVQKHTRTQAGGLREREGLQFLLLNPQYSEKRNSTWNKNPSFMRNRNNRGLILGGWDEQNLFKRQGCFWTVQRPVHLSFGSISPALPVSPLWLWNKSWAYFHPCGAMERGPMTPKQGGSIFSEVPPAAHTGSRVMEEGPWKEGSTSCC